MDTEEFRQYLRIDKLTLDEELQYQPSLMYEAGEQYADACAERDAAKEALERTRAQVDANIRQLAEDNGERITEAVVANRVRLDDDYIAAQEHYTQTTTTAEYWRAMRDAVSQRGSMLRELSALFIGEYWSKNSVESGQRKSQHGKAAEGRAAMAEKRKEYTSTEHKGTNKKPNTAKKNSGGKASGSKRKSI